MLKSYSARVPVKFSESRFDMAASLLFPQLSRKKIKSIIDNGGAYVNKKRIKVAKHALVAGDTIELFFEIAGSTKETTANNILIHEHENFFIVNKPAGIPSQATLTSSNHHIFSTLQKIDPVKFKQNNMFLVHRLDKDTSGLMIIAKNKAVQKEFEDLFLEKKIQKIYQALCYYVPKQLKGEINFPLAKSNGQINTYFAMTNPNSKIPGAKSALTLYECLKNFKNLASHIQCFPKTGRTHQIRAHLAAIGCPVLGDKTYAQNIYGHPFAQIALRHMLHAAQLEFELGGQKYVFKAELPQDFVDVLKLLTAG